MLRYKDFKEDQLSQNYQPQGRFTTQAIPTTYTAQQNPSNVNMGNSITQNNQSMVMGPVYNNQNSILESGIFDQTMGQSLRYSTQMKPQPFAQPSTQVVTTSQQAQVNQPRNAMQPQPYSVSQNQPQLNIGQGSTYLGSSVMAQQPVQRLQSRQGNNSSALRMKEIASKNRFRKDLVQPNIAKQQMRYKSSTGSSRYQPASIPAKLAMINNVHTSPQAQRTQTFPSAGGVKPIQNKVHFQGSFGPKADNFMKVKTKEPKSRPLNKMKSAMSKILHKGHTNDTNTNPMSKLLKSSNNDNHSHGPRPTPLPSFAKEFPKNERNYSPALPPYEKQTSKIVSPVRQPQLDQSYQQPSHYPQKQMIDNSEKKSVRFDPKSKTRNSKRTESTGDPFIDALNDSQSSMDDTEDINIKEMLGIRPAKQTSDSFYGNSPKNRFISHRQNGNQGDNGPSFRRGNQSEDLNSGTNKRLLNDDFLDRVEETKVVPQEGFDAYKNKFMTFVNDQVDKVNKKTQKGADGKEVPLTDAQKKEQMMMMAIGGLIALVVLLLLFK